MLFSSSPAARGLLLIVTFVIPFACEPLEENAPAPTWPEPFGDSPEDYFFSYRANFVDSFYLELRHGSIVDYVERDHGDSHYIDSSQITLHVSWSSITGYRHCKVSLHNVDLTMRARQAVTKSPPGFSVGEADRANATGYTLEGDGIVDVMKPIPGGTSYIEIDSFDREAGHVEGRFGLVLVHDMDYGQRLGKAGFPDTLVIDDGYFSTYLGRPWEHAQDGG